LHESYVRSRGSTIHTSTAFDEVLGRPNEAAGRAAAEYAQASICVVLAVTGPLPVGPLNSALT
jgi:hypothetical protein